MELMTIQFNGAEIPCPFADGDRMVPVRHICEAIDVQFKNQDTALKNSSFFGPVYPLVGTPTKQNNTQPMRCLPLNLVIAWLSSIQENNRRTGSVEKQHDLMRILLERMKETYQLVEIVAQANNYQLQLIRNKEELMERYQIDKARVAATKRELDKVNASIDEVLSNQSKGIIELPFEEMQKMEEAYIEAVKNS
jgi:hypothetical protein